jgi:hypothetical protein
VDKKQAQIENAMEALFTEAGFRNKQFKKFDENERYKSVVDND